MPVERLWSAAPPLAPARRLAVARVRRASRVLDGVLLEPAAVLRPGHRHRSSGAAGRGVREPARGRRDRPAGRAAAAPPAARPAEARRLRLRGHGGCSPLICPASLAGGLLHRPRWRPSAPTWRPSAAATHDYVVAQEPAYEPRLAAIDVLRIEDDLYRSCVPGPGPRPLAVPVRQHRPAARRASTADRDRAPNCAVPAARRVPLSVSYAASGAMLWTDVRWTAGEAQATVRAVRMRCGIRIDMAGAGTRLQRGAGGSLVVAALCCLRLRRRRCSRSATGPARATPGPTAASRCACRAGKAAGRVASGPVAARVAAAPVAPRRRERPARRAPLRRRRAPRPRRRAAASAPAHAAPAAPAPAPAAPAAPAPAPVAAPPSRRRRSPRARGPAGRTPTGPAERGRRDRRRTSAARSRRRCRPWSQEPVDSPCSRPVQPVGRRGRRPSPAAAACRSALRPATSCARGPDGHRARAAPPRARASTGCPSPGVPAPGESRGCRATVPAYPMPDWVWAPAVLDDAARLAARLPRRDGWTSSARAARGRCRRASRTR